MKLRNKKTGEIVDLYEGLIREDGERITIKPVAVLEKCYIYHSLAELNEEWEDYEEPKEYWYIDWNGEVCRSDIHDKRTEQMKLIGNYFETKEEAEKAVEKFKARKRLEDKGFRFIDHLDRDSGQGMCRYEWNGYINGEELLLPDEIDLDDDDMGLIEHLQHSLGQPVKDIDIDAICNNGKMVSVANVGEGYALVSVTRLIKESEFDIRDYGGGQ